MYSLDISEIISCSMFGRMRQTNGWETKQPRAIHSNIFVLMIEGAASFCIEEICYDVAAGDVLIIPAETVYHAETDSSCEYFFFHFSGRIKKDSNISVLSTANDNFSFRLPKCRRDRIFFNLKTSDKVVFNKIYTSVIACVEYNSYLTQTGRLLIDTEFFKIMLMLGSVSERTSSELPAALEKMIIYIKKNLTKPISLSKMCTQCCISAPYAARLFKRNLNMTATEYINSEKLYYACELIKNTNMNISEISDYLGYCDVFYFSKLFKKKFGKSPSKYFFQ